MITLNEIAYNIKNLAYGGRSSTESNISISQIKHWVHYHRAKLIAENDDKGITRNNSIYQSIPLTTYNSADRYIRYYIKELVKVLRDKSGVMGMTLASLNEYLLNARMYANGEPYAEWMAISQNVSSSFATFTEPYESGNQHWLDQYGRETASTLQNKGDYRNFGYHKFEVPSPIQLKNNKGIREVSLSRSVLYANGTDDGYNSQFNKSIKLYNKEYGDFDEYNKFTNNSKPYYSQETSRHSQLGDNSFVDSPAGVNPSSNHIISINQLQVSPNYIEGKALGVAIKVFWNYRAKADIILENPTSINNIYQEGVYNFMSNIDSSEAINTAKWDDSTNPYPIPMEYVSDLIQRVVQVEMQIELKTNPELVIDGIDDSMKSKKQGGTQV